MLQFSGVFHCHQYHFNQMKSLLFSLCLPMEMDAWMARNRCILKKVELRDAESLYWPEMAYVEIPYGSLNLGTIKKAYHFRLLELKK